MNPSSENGQSMAEYAVILSLIAVAAAAAFAFLGGSIVGLFQHALDVIGAVV
jgi:Flp pilus assembly pilin Flp